MAGCVFIGDICVRKHNSVSVFFWCWLHLPVTHHNTCAIYPSYPHICIVRIERVYEYTSILDAHQEYDFSPNATELRIKKKQYGFFPRRFSYCLPLPCRYRTQRKK